MVIAGVPLVHPYVKICFQMIQQVNAVFLHVNRIDSVCASDISFPGRVNPLLTGFSSIF